MASKTLGLCVASFLLLGACATAPRHGVPTRPSLQTLQGEVVLADGKAVANVGVVLRCGDSTLRTRSDAHGRFSLRGVAMGPRCQAWLERDGKRHQRALWAVNRASNLLRARSPLHLEVKPTHRLRAELLGPKGQRSRLLLDEARRDPRGLRPWGRAAKLEYRHPGWGQLTIRLSKKAGQLALRSVEGLPKGWRLARTKMARLATLPAALRSAPRDLDRLRLELLRSGKARRLETLAGERSVIWVGTCAELKPALERDLAGLEASRGLWGLRTLVVTTDRCGAAARPKKQNAPPVYWGGPAVSWAFGVSSATLFVMGRDGGVPWRRAVADQVSGVGHAMSYLRGSWPVFAAAERVSVESSATVSRATVTRLLGQAEALARRGESKAASALFDRVLQLAPKHAEAHRRRALIKAALGDLSGAMSDVSWWRDTYGDHSADELLDQVQRSSPAGASLR